MYELWETRSGNLVGAYASTDEALDVVRHAVASHGPNALASLSLEEADDEGKGLVLAAGTSLVAMATSQEPPRREAAG